MNIAIAVILTLVVTNWTEIGTMTTTQGKKFSVLEGKLQTNLVAEIQWSEYFNNTNDLFLHRGSINTNTFVLKSFPGPVIGEKRIEITNVWINYKWPTNTFWITNKNVSW